MSKIIELNSYLSYFKMSVIIILLSSLSTCISLYLYPPLSLCLCVSLSLALSLPLSLSHSLSRSLSQYSGTQGSDMNKHIQELPSLALDFMSSCGDLEIDYSYDRKIRPRIGIHTGSYSYIHRGTCIVCKGYRSSCSW